MQLIFDFDGTLVDSLDAVITNYNILAEENNFRKIESVESDVIRNLNSKELIKYLKIPIYKIPAILLKARKMMSGEICSLVPISHLPQVLQKLHDANFSLGIVSSNSEENVQSWLATNNMENLFTFIHSEPNFFGKAHVIRKFLNKYKSDKQRVFYIGDETRDIDAARQNEIYSIAVTWGFNSEAILAQHQPDYMAKTPQDLLAICGLPEEAGEIKN